MVPVNLSLSKCYILMIVMGPLLTGIALSIVFSETFTDAIPKNLNTTQWSEHSTALQADFRIRNRNGAAVVLVIAHTLQLYICWYRPSIRTDLKKISRPSESTVEVGTN